LKPSSGKYPAGEVQPEDEYCINLCVVRNGIKLQKMSVGNIVALQKLYRKEKVVEVQKSLWQTLWQAI
jgi:hypothetical protein